MSTLVPETPAERRHTRPGLVPLDERDDLRRSVPMSELVLVDSYEAQGWRVREDERLDRLFEARCDWIHAYGREGQLAVDTAELSLTYDELDARANRLARFLRLRGAAAGDRVGLLFDRATDGYVAALAVLKIGAAYVPMDPDLPTAHTAAVVEDARVRTVLSASDVVARVDRLDLLTAGGTEVVQLDRAARLVDEQSAHRLLPVERGTRDGSLALITYRPGPDGRPTGVAVDHRSACNAVKVAAEVYGIRPWDRVYQGVPLAHDPSVEEVWVPWVVGATLVPRPAGAGLRGRSLHSFLDVQRVTALCGTPELLATLEADLPALRFLLVSGRGCPQDLVRRWHRPGRRFVGVYGPAAATLSVTWTELHPDKAPTLGIPLPTCSTVVLDRADPFRALPHGQVGEIGIAGVGLTGGHLDHDDPTDTAFIPDFLGIPANPSGRILRTGDLGRVNPDGELEYHGRLDGPAPVRDDLTESDVVEAAVLPAPEPPAPALPVPQAVALPVPEAVALPVPEAVALPVPVPVPVPVPQAVALPVPQAVTLPAPQAVALPASQATDAVPAAPAAAGRVPGLERELAGLLADGMGVEEVGVDAHFFEDLGADSMVMARFCARLRKREDLPTIGMRDVYAHPTITALATAFGTPAAAADADEGSEPPVLGTQILRAVRAVRAVRAPRHRQAPTGRQRYALCGALQLLFLVAYPSVTGYAVLSGVEWIAAGPGVVEVYLRSVVVGTAAFVGLSALPVLVKWVLVGRWTPQEIPVWSLAYFRFWVVRTLVQRNPMALFAGSPLYPFYLRALGARVGRGAAIFSKNVPVCTDMLTIGAGAVIRKDSFFTGYRAHNGVIQTGAVTIGADALVGDQTVLDIWTSLGAGAQLGHSSALHAGQTVPDGERRHGSPAQRTDVDYRGVGTAACGTARRVVFSAVQLLNLLVVGLPLGVGGMILLLAEVPQLVALLGPGPLALRDWTFSLYAVAFSAALVVGYLVVGLLLVCTVPRVLSLAIRADRVYPLYGFHYWALRAIARTTNVKFFAFLFGDSSYIVGYLRGIGYDLSEVEQTGSNFGQRVKHDSPFLSSVGPGTVVADGLSIVNADFSSTSFRVSRTSIGAHNFLGNNIAYPSQGRTGDDCLLATKVMVPIDGPVREGVGLLGSPSFEIPRSVQRDIGFDLDSGEQHRRLRAKNRHNLVTMALFLFVRWFAVFALTLIGILAADLHHAWGAAVVVPAEALVLLVTVTWFVLVERAVMHLQALRPTGCSIYDRAFWRHERFWKVPTQAYLTAFHGTPLKNVLSRLLGVRLGRRVFDDGCAFVEKTFVSVGDGCTLNAGSIVQCHSQEDGAFKSDRTAIGPGSTLGVGAFVHYGVTMGENAVLAADSFLMKGEDVPANARWGGNPAKEMRGDSADLRVRRITIDIDRSAALVRGE